MKNTYEQASPAKDGIMVGGDTKLAQLRNPRPPFAAVNNPWLQRILMELAKGCAESYVPIDIDFMEATYGVTDSVQLVSSTPVAAIEIRCDNDTAQRMRKQAAPRVPQHLPVASPPSNAPSLSSDPCQVNGYLSSHIYLYETFSLHQAAPDCDDKSADQFEIQRRRALSSVQQRPSLDYSHLSQSGTSDDCLRSSKDGSSSFDARFTTFPLRPPPPSRSMESYLSRLKIPLSQPRGDADAVVGNAAQPGPSRQSLRRVPRLESDRSRRSRPKLSSRGPSPDAALLKRAWRMVDSDSEPEATSANDFDGEPAAKRRA